MDKKDNPYDVVISEEATQILLSHVSIPVRLN